MAEVVVVVSDEDDDQHEDGVDDVLLHRPRCRWWGRPGNRVAVYSHPGTVIQRQWMPDAVDQMVMPCAGMRVRRVIQRSRMSVSFASRNADDCSADDQSHHCPNPPQCPQCHCRLCVNLGIR